MNLFRKSALVAGLGLLVMLSACASMVANMAAVSPVPNYLFIHAGATPGDFARYRSLDGSQLLLLELLGVTGSAGAPRYRVRSSWPHATGPGAGFLRSHAYEFDVAPDGRVLYAELVELASGARRPVPVAGPGQVGHIRSPVLRELGGEERLQAAGIEHGIDGVLVYEDTRQAAGGSMAWTSTNFMNRRLPFGLVRQVNVVNTELPAMEVLAVVSAAAPTGQAVKALLGRLLRASSKQRVERGLELVEYERKN